ncbi:putative SAM-dependent methyltransferases [Bradyrhizobium sp. ORS 278]|uniref:class I SAM-dependent methyltransferase n=1 Tax=Bradyrhizobium sp. (strain ORS 278) TaxID=114615 RepID=UPI0001507E4E|nr:class I SAM-dependent methyltransferase [Bradyrhizobium sp. ORS 278]CAL75207.1 putative SAM-dependent methyltransferases [Bradyrhizobium sp. ORS 278]
MEQRFTFDAVAGLYKTARPDYPKALIDDVVSYADLKADDRILEVGCGTGQATLGFATLGFSILATDPGPEMLRGARESLAGFDNVAFLETTFEAFPEHRPTFRLIIAAQSWHWVSPGVRFSKAATVLSHGGTLAVFGHVPVGLPAPLLKELEQTYLRLIGSWQPPPEAWYLPNGPFRSWFEQSGLFEAIEHKCYRWKRQQTTSGYTDYLRSRSDHRMLQREKRDEVLREVANAIDKFGGHFELDYETHLYIARRMDRELDA